MSPRCWRRSTSTCWWLSSWSPRFYTSLVTGFVCTWSLCYTTRWWCCARSLAFPSSSGDPATSGTRCKSAMALQTGQMWALWGWLTTGERHVGVSFRCHCLANTKDRAWYWFVSFSTGVVRVQWWIRLMLMWSETGNFILRIWGMVEVLYTHNYAFIMTILVKSVMCLLVAANNS